MSKLILAFNLLPYTLRVRFAITSIYMLFAIIIESCYLYLMPIFINTFLPKTTQTDPVSISLLANIFFFSFRSSTFQIIFLSLLSLSILNNYISARATSSLNAEISSVFSQKSLSAIADNSFQWNMLTKNSDKMSLLTTHPVNSSIYLFHVLNLLSSFGSLIFISLASFLISPSLSIIFLLFITALACIIYAFARPTLANNTSKYERSQRTIYDHSNSIIRSISAMYIDKDLKAALTKLYTQDSANLFYSKSEVDFTSQYTKTLIERLLVVFLALFLYSTKHHEVNLSSIFPVLGTFAIISLRVTQSFQQCINSVSYIRLYQPSVSAITTAYSLSLDNSTNLTRSLSKPTRNRNNLHGETFHCLEFSNVYYSHGGASQPLIESLNLRIDLLKRYAVIGSSGSGKTTFLNLAMGLLKPDSGSVKLDGKCIHTTPGLLEEWQASFKTIPQDFFIFPSTLLYNITLSHKFPESEVDISSLSMALETSCLSDYVNSLPHKLESYVGENGSLLSGGLRQRLILARSLYSYPCFLFLDEFTSSLDPSTEQEIIRNMITADSAPPFLCIAHRYSVLQSTDFIINSNANFNIQQSS